MAKQLVEVAIPPGFVDGTKRQVKQRWISGNHVRFRDGRLRPIGGWQEFPLSRHSASVDSAVRGHHQWRNNLGVGLMAFGTAGAGAGYGKLLAMEIVNPATFTDATADTTSGSASITVDDAAQFEVGDLITGSGIPTGSSITAVSGNTVTISNNATTTNSNITVTVTPTESRQRLVDVTPSGYQATGDSEFRPGYGYFYYGKFYDYGTVYSGAGSASFSRLAHWSLDNFGENLIGTQSGDRGMFYWQGDVGTVGGSPTLAQEITTANGYTETAPTAVAVLVTQERHVLALGAGGDLRKIQFSSQETIDVWTPSATNTAGDLTLQTTGFIVCAKRVQGGVLVWTETDVHQLNYLGPPLVYGIQKLADNAGVLSPYAIYSSSEITTWINRGGFWIYDGYARPLQCPIEDRVMRTVDFSQEGLIYSGGNAEFGEVWWWLPSRTGTTGQCNYYVVYNYRDGIWYDSFNDSGITRNAWIDKNVYSSVLAVDPSDNTIYMHENTDPAQTTVAEAETGAIDVMKGERFSRISKIFTDSDQQAAGNINYKFFTAASGDADETESGDFPLEADGEIDVRLQGRQVRYKVSGALANDWTVGNTRFETHIGGRR